MMKLGYLKQKKAQASVETLMIYGVTIFIVMLAIGALIGFGVIDLGRLLPDKCEISNALSCEAYIVTQTRVQMQLKNTLGRNIGSIKVNITGEGNDEGMWNCQEKPYGALANGVVSDVILLDCDIQIPPGRKINGVINIKYLPVGLLIEQPITGSIRATVS